MKDVLLSEKIIFKRTIISNKILLVKKPWKIRILFIALPFISLCIILILLITGPKKAVSSDVNHPVTEIENPVSPVITDYIEFIKARLDSAHNIGAAVAIVNKDDILIIKTFGVKKAGTNDSVDIHTVFRLASVSKGFSGILTCILDEEGILSLQDKVISFLPNFRLKDSINTQDLNIQHLLSHTSGLVPHAYDNLIEDGMPLPLIVKNLSEVDISAPPGVLYGYQNVVFSLIDTIAFIQTGTRFGNLMEKYIFRPLHMRDASVGQKIFTRKNANFAYPHRRASSSYIAAPLNLGYYNISPAAGVNASISDLSKWLQALLGHNPAVLDSQVLAKITEPKIESPLKYRYLRCWDKIDSKYYSLGWRIYQYKGRRIMYHGGYVKGYRAEIAFCPEENIGIAFLQNSPNGVASVSVPAFFNSYFHYLETDSIHSSSDSTFFDGFNLLLEDSVDDFSQF